MFPATTGNNDVVGLRVARPALPDEVADHERAQSLAPDRRVADQVVDAQCPCRHRTDAGELDNVLRVGGDRIALNQSHRATSGSVNHCATRGKSRRRSRTKTIRWRESPETLTAPTLLARVAADDHRPVRVHHLPHLSASLSHRHKIGWLTSVFTAVGRVAAARCAGQSPPGTARVRGRQRPWRKARMARRADHTPTRGLGGSQARLVGTCRPVLSGSRYKPARAMRPMRNAVVFSSPNAVTNG